jgi:hypothetical protein
MQKPSLFSNVCDAAAWYHPWTATETSVEGVSSISARRRKEEEISL